MVGLRIRLFILHFGSASMIVDKITEIYIGKQLEEPI